MGPRDPSGDHQMSITTGSPSRRGGVPAEGRWRDPEPRRKVCGQPRDWHRLDDHPDLNESRAIGLPPEAREKSSRANSAQSALISRSGQWHWSMISGSTTARHELPAGSCPPLARKFLAALDNALASDGEDAAARRDNSSVVVRPAGVARRPATGRAGFRLAPRRAIPASPAPREVELVCP